MSGEEARLVADAIESNWVAPVGPYVDAFETAVSREVDDVHAVALCSGTAALHLALILAGVERDSDVLLPTLTFAATANAATYIGARPVFVDATASTWQMDADMLSEELARRAKSGDLPSAVVTVDLYGQCSDYDRIVESCASYGVPLVEDAAEALGATYHGKPAGSFGTAAALSFNGNKIITTSGGGMLLTRDADLAERARYLATQARQPEPHYEHRDIGFNYRMSNVLAAIGVAQMAVLHERRLRRQDHNRFYREALAGLPGVEFMPEAGDGEPTWWLTCLTIDPNESQTDAESVREHLGRLGIESRPVWKPMHMQPVFAGLPAVGGAVAERLFATGLCLPSGSSLTDVERTEVVTEVRGMFGAHGRSS
jgi:dTDP-4-amino-4,6-dideoxygalactose transaminase